MASLVIHLSHTTPLHPTVLSELMLYMFNLHFFFSSSAFSTIFFLKVWVGANLNQTGKWTWTDKTGVNMTSLWGTGEPNNRGGDEKCVEINVEGKLNDLPCTASRQFVCMELKKYNYYQLFIYKSILYVS